MRRAPCRRPVRAAGTRRRCRFRRAGSRRFHTHARGAASTGRTHRTPAGPRRASHTICSPAPSTNRRPLKFWAAARSERRRKLTSYEKTIIIRALRRPPPMDTDVKFHAPAKPAAPAFESLHARALDLFALPFNDLLFRAHTEHRGNFDPNRVQRSTLLSIKTGGCPEDCGYCPQAARYHTGVENQPLMPLDDVVAAARRAKDNGATRFCMGAAWRGPEARDLEPVVDMVRSVKAPGLGACCTLGIVKQGQAEQLRASGLDYYSHNLD